jgi:hypothetical protein
LPTGEVNVELIFAADAPKPATGGEVTLLVNGEPVASGLMEHTVEHDGADAVAGPLANAIRTSTARERDPHLDRTDRQGLRRGAESRIGGGIGETRRVT